MISVVAVMDDGGQVEVATVAREGMAGLPVFLGSPVSIHRVISQVAGDGMSLSAADLLSETARGDRLCTNLLRYTQVRLAMTGQTAACIGAHPIRARLARWLLISHDSVVGDAFTLTQEFLSHMLGAQRTSITAAAHALNGDGLISYHRGAVRILDRARLERAACECYGLVRAETLRLIGPSAA
jgi:CRP-like cAMP-binding protein